MIIDSDQLKSEMLALGFELSAEQIEKFDTYAALLTEWNSRINLTAITEPAAIVTKHFVDSATFLKAAAPEQGASVIDVGSGAGFPGIPTAILRGDIKLTLIDGTNKRVEFLKTVCRELGIDATAIHGRAEELAHRADLRERFDFATARAVAALGVLGEYCLGFVKTGGSFIAMKGPSAEDEVADGSSAIKAMGGKTEEIRSFTLADKSERRLVVIKKISQTSTQYPRVSAKIAKKPL